MQIYVKNLLTESIFLIFCTLNPIWAIGPDLLIFYIDFDICCFDIESIIEISQNWWRKKTTTVIVG